MKYTEEFFAVQIPRCLKKTGLRLAIGGVHAGPRLFYFKDGAERFKDALIQDGYRAKVVKVKVSYTWEANP